MTKSLTNQEKKESFESRFFNPSAFSIYFVPLIGNSNCAAISQSLLSCVKQISSLEENERAYNVNKGTCFPYFNVMTLSLFV